MAEHTPGPWQIGLTANRCQIYTRSGYSVGFAREEFGKINGTTAEANARLIAAAPDLLAAAKRSLQGWDNAIELAIILPQHRNTATILADELRAAIAKATAQQEG